MRRKYAPELYFLAAFCAALILALFNTKWTKHDASATPPRSTTNQQQSR